MVAPSTGITKLVGIKATTKKKVSAEAAMIRRTFAIFFMVDESVYLQYDKKPFENVKFCSSLYPLTPMMVMHSCMRRIVSKEENRLLSL
jgi:hypothetical protein